MVEKVTGERLKKYLREHIFGPLGMADTSLKVSPSQRERLLAMHARGADGSLEPIEFEMPQKPEFFTGGGLYSTGSDYLKCTGDGRRSKHRVLMPLPLLMLWTAPPPARECHECGRC
jgi:CubicO group peptidase (beta-lactamase class C family)